MLLIGDKDVMDTWATSALTPQLVLDKVGSDKISLPFDIRPQAHDIIRTWAFYTIAKALMHSNTIPWHEVLISGFILDPDRKKMSKSKGNVVTPQHLIDTYGADSIRYWAARARLGVDTAFEEQIMAQGKKLVNKIFNAGKFVFNIVSQSALKDEIESINSNRSNKMSFAKINRLQQKLQQYGEMGQTRLASSEGDFNQYEAIINSKDGIILNAKDFGTATAGIGHELINHANKGWTLDIISFMLGQYAVGTGNHTVSNADKTDELKNEASQTNKANESQVNSLKNEVQNVTGVEGFSITADGEQEAEDKEKIEKQTAAATETDKAASASLDQVLMAKIRKGQDVEA